MTKKNPNGVWPFGFDSTPWLTFRMMAMIIV